MGLSMINRDFIRRHQYDFFFFIMLISILFLSVQKAQNGMGTSDEHFYISLTKRLFEGDAFIFDEWFVGQTMAIPLLPFYGISKFLFLKKVGIVLLFRYFYIFFTLLVGSGIYIKFRNYKVWAILSSIIYMLFTPFQIMALSYNTMSIGFLTLSYLLCDGKGKKTQKLISGILFGIAVLNSPLLIVVYLILSCAILFHSRFCVWREWAVFSVGAFLIGAISIYIILSKASLDQILLSIPYLVDPSHSQSILTKLLRNSYQLYEMYLAYLPILIGELIFILFCKKNRAPQFDIVFFIVNTFLMVDIFFLRSYRLNQGGFVAILLPHFILQLIFSKKSTHYSSYLIFGIILSCLHMLFLSLSSNVGPRAFLSPLILSCTLFPIQFAKIDYKLKYVAVSEMIFFIFLLAYAKVNFYYLESKDFKVKISEGPLSGLYDSSERVNMYRTKLEDINFLNDLSQGKTLLITHDSWMYLALEKKVYTNSTYMYYWHKKDFIQAQERYIKLHNNHLPDYIYIEYDNPYTIDISDFYFHDHYSGIYLNSGTLMVRR